MILTVWRKLLIWMCLKMSKKRFRLRDYNDEHIGCSEISDNDDWITYGEIVNLLNDYEELKSKLL